MREDHLVLIITCFSGAMHPALGMEAQVVSAWDEAALRGVYDSRLPAPEVARALAIVDACMYDGWAAYDDHANGIQLKDALRRLAIMSTLSNTKKRRLVTLRVEPSMACFPRLKYIRSPALWYLLVAIGLLGISDVPKRMV